MWIVFNISILLWVTYAYFNGVYEKAEFISSTTGASSKPTAGTPYGNNVVFIDTGSTSPLSYGPIVPYSTVQGTGTAGTGLGSNIESNVGWTASTINATAGFHSNNGLTTTSGTVLRTTKDNKLWTDFVEKNKNGTTNP